MISLGWPGRRFLLGALKGQEKIDRAERRAKPGAAPWVTGHPRKGTLKGYTTPLVQIVTPNFQGADDSLGSQPRAALRGLAPALCPGLDCDGPPGR